METEKTKKKKTVEAKETKVVKGYKRKFTFPADGDRPGVVIEAADIREAEQLYLDN